MGVPFDTLIRPIVAHLAAEYRLAGGPAAEAMIVAIGLQESGFEVRDQLEVQGGRLVAGAVGPATGFWQFERGGGVRGVMRHPASRTIAQALTEAAGVAWDEDSIWRVFTRPEGDELACVFARLLLLTDAQPLPAATAEGEEAAFAYYLRNWRPGAWFGSAEGSAKRAELRVRWGRWWRQAVALVGAAGAAAVPVPLPSGELEVSVEVLFAEVEGALRRLREAIEAPG